jgi:hypothetical protein
VVGKEEVKQMSENTNLQKGAGKMNALTQKGNFEQRPHPSPDVHGWQDISTAPRNGTPVPTVLEQPPESGPWDRELVKAIAMDIGKEVVAYIEVQYPKAIEATPSTFKLSIRNCIYNQIMAAIEINDAGQIAARLETRKKWRREWTAAYRKIRGKPLCSGGGV